MFESIDAIINWIITCIIVEDEGYNDYKSLSDYDLADELTLEQIKNHLRTHIKSAPEVLDWDDTQWNDFMSTPWGEGLEGNISELHVAITDVANWLPLN